MDQSVYFLDRICNRVCHKCSFPVRNLDRLGFKFEILGNYCIFSASRADLGLPFALFDKAKFYDNRRAPILLYLPYYLQPAAV